MQWSELKEKAKEMGAYIYISDFNDGFERIDFRNASFFQNGCVSFSSELGFVGGVIIIAENRSKEQMLMIMKGLE